MYIESLLFSYMSSNEIKRKDNCYLNGDHTHFIFVDDGSRYRFFGKYSDFITRFETMVREEPPKVSLRQYKQAVLGCIYLQFPL